MTRTERDLALLQDMLTYARRGTEFVTGRESHDLRQDIMLALALERAIEIVGEAPKGVSEATRASYPQVPWRDIIRTRDFLAHAYYKLDPDILWTIATQNLPDLIAALDP